MAPALRARPGGALNLWLLPHPAVVPRDEVGRFAAAAQPAPGRQQPPPWRTLFLYWQCRSGNHPAAQTQEEYASAQRPRMGAAAQPQGQRQPGAALQFSQGRSAARRENWLSARGFKRVEGGFRKKSKTASPALRPQPAQTWKDQSAVPSRCLRQKQCPHPAGQGRFLRIAPGGAPLTESTQNSLTRPGGGAFLCPAPALSVIYTILSTKPYKVYTIEPGPRLCYT